MVRKSLLIRCAIIILLSMYLWHRCQHIQIHSELAAYRQATVYLTPGWLIEEPKVKFETGGLLGEPSSYYFITESYIPILSLYGDINYLNVIYRMSEEKSGKTIALINVSEMNPSYHSEEEKAWQLLQQNEAASLYQSEKAFKIENSTETIVVEYSCNDDQREGVAALVENVVIKNFNKGVNINEK